MTRYLSSIVFVAFFFVTHSAQANIEIRFIEGAPKDQFVIKNTGACLLKSLTVEIDLANSAGKLIFDTTAVGAGVEVFQPFETAEGSISLATQKGVQDGDSKLTVNIPSLPSGQVASFTIDVDDTLPNSELGKIRVTGSEIKNGIVKVNSGTKKFTKAVFGSDSKATVVQKACSAA